MPSHEIAKDDICMTNLSQPGGLVKVLGVIWDTDNKRTVATIEFLEDHPYGYSKGTKGCYALDDLIFIRTMNIHDQMRQRILSRAEYEQYLSCYRKMDRDGYWLSGFEEWPYEDVFSNGMSNHAFAIRDHVRSVRRDPQWVHYHPVSEGYELYHADRLSGLGGDAYEARIEQLAEEWKADQGW